MDILANPVKVTQDTSPFDFSDLIVKCDLLMKQYWDDNPDLYQIVQQKKQESMTLASKKRIADGDSENAHTNSTKTNNTTDSDTMLFLKLPLRGAKLRAKINESHREIRKRVLSVGANIIPLTQAHNRKNSCASVEDKQAFRAKVVAAQIRSWRSMLPNLIRQFSKIPDYRRTLSTKHKLTVLMVFGLFAFIFRLSSRREMNRELTSPIIFNHLKRLFPELDSIPHADTLARALENTNPKGIEAIHIGLIKLLIKKKKFKKLLIQDCLPISVDGTQKLTRNGLVNDDRWCERKMSNAESDDKQLYIYVLEANITLKNGLNIPLMSEYLFRDNNELTRAEGKQDSELTAFERLAKRLKRYFPRLKILLMMDGMFATQSAMGLMHAHRWEYLIRLPKRKLTDFAKQLNNNKSQQMVIPDQSYYRKRKQSFYWQNHITTGYEWQLTVHLVACFEEYYTVNQKTGEIEKSISEHTWISSIALSIDNVHELLNGGARKLELIENGINTEKNRGYHYKHAYSYNWNAMQGFHHLMRLGHAINALSEFKKTLKKLIKDFGCSATLKLIKETLFAPWLPPDWYSEQNRQSAQLRFQLE